MAEIREALGRSRTALFEAGGREQDDQSTALQHARSHLHQAHGALQIVDVDGVTLMTQVAEEALDRFKSGALKCNADNARTVANLYQAITEFLEELLAGAPFQPVRLFPYYRAVQEMLGAERIHPADLFFPDLSALARMPAATTVEAPDYTAYRQRFERALLPYMKATEPDAQTAQTGALRDAVAQVAEAQSDPKARTFWLAMQAFAELAAAGQLDHGRYVKQLFGLINLQMRRLAQGDASLPDNMLREALFFIAGADHDHVSPLAHHLCSVFGIEGTVPADVEAKRYGRIDAEALARAREAMAAAKAAWQRLLDAVIDPQLDAEFSQALAVVAVACDKLGVAALAALMRQLAQVANAAVTKGRSEALSLEMTTALLFAEHGLEHIRHLPDTFPAHADTIGVRLQALLAGDGDGAPPPAQWQLGLAHQLQQDDTVAALAGEMKTGLRQVEKVLDDYYGDPSLRPSLRSLDSVLHQLHGALAVLDQEDAVFATEHVRKEIAKLAGGQGDPAQEPRVLDDIAQNVGALGFFVDMLAQNPSGAKERYAFDAAQGTFRAVPFKKLAASAPVPVLEEEVESPTSPPTPAPQAAAASPSDAAIEEELLDIFIAEAQEVLVFVNETLAKPRSEAGTLEHLTMLRRSFHTLKGSGRMVGLNQFADGAAAIERTMNTWLAEERPATEALFGLLERAARDLTAWVDELVAHGVSQRNADALVAAAAQVQAGGPFDMADEAAATPAEPAAGLESVPEAAVDEPAPGATAAEPQDAAPVESSAQIVDFTPPSPTRDEDASHELGQVIAFPVAPPPTADVIEFHPNVAPLLPPEDDDVKHVGALTIPLPLYNIYLAETDELARLLARDFGEWRHEPGRPVSADALQAAHTLAGTSGTVGFTALRDLAYALESTLEGLRAPAPQLDPTQHDLLDFTAERMHQMLLGFAQGEVAPDQPELIEALQRMRDELARLQTPDGAFDAHMDAVFADADAQADARADAVPAAPQEGESALAAQLDALFAEAYNDLSGKPPPESDFFNREPVLTRAPEAKTASPVNDDIDDLFDTAFDDAFAAPLSQIAAPAPQPQAPDLQDEWAAQQQPAAPQPLPPLDELPPAPEPLPLAQQEPLADTPQDEPLPAPEAEPVPVHELALEPEPEPGLADATVPEEQLQALADLEPEMPELAVLSVEHVPASPPETLPSSPDVQVLELPDAPAELAVAPPGSYTDEIDADLLPVFLEEGADLLPQVGHALRAWQRNPTDFSHAHMLQRVLHTVKGSARMAGAMRLGQHAHEIETHIENMVHANSATPHAFEELLTHYDHALVLFEQLQHPQPVQAPAAEAAQGEPAAAPAVAAQEDDSASRTPLVRVRADILDRLVNQAGEVSILRSRLENEVGALRTSLNDFSENLARLRRQLREVEMQAESQIASRMSISSDREFDPLEFDRFTRLQELTRMMAESVNDVASFHESLLRSVDTASTDLTQQARMTRELQRDLMRVRMVPFASISERLFRVARLAAKETDKRVNLDIRGGAVEIDRGVLERMAAPFEHLLRNAIVHGVEPRAERHAAGKDETGELLIQVSQQGNEVVLAFSDDGAGLDLDRIRAKARSVGLLDDGEEISDADAACLIFEPGFSTAETLTEQAGRGVGMDIVRSEAQLLGGRVDTASERGKGACFTIRLPLTLAVTQVVLVRAGGRPFAMPSTLVEQVLQMKESALSDARSKGHVVIQGMPAPLHYLPTMLGDAQAQPAAQRSSPVLILKAGDDRLALQVDDVQGNREVVIKNIGPQLARMAGIAGATVLGSGEIVLILNPLALARHLAEHPELRVEPVDGGLQMVAATGRTIMVVDDSLTVRKVTQRLLEREGYQVVLAKDGVDALEQMRDSLPDMMLVDIEMPRMDGFDLTRNVRGDDRTRDIPIIMITSRSADKHRNYAMQLGVNAYFGKPFQEPVLLGAIESLLSQQAA
ncbi:response regulator [Duganella ginsengisoli]|uniref:Chemotaxis protein CheA n=2 Tax=Pseudoduganella ginsengisoli TaxID=1462440 RepID=A0A6L6PUJ8_9BURK|nr:response regulator [Pseudoduganella ginsengisoli]